MDVFDCHFLADRPRSLAFQVSLVYEYFVFSPHFGVFDAFRDFSYMPMYCEFETPCTIPTYIESTIVLSGKHEAIRIPKSENNMGAPSEPKT